MLRTHTRFSSASHPSAPRGYRPIGLGPFASPHMPCGLKKGKKYKSQALTDSLVCTGRNDLRKMTPAERGHLGLPASSPTIEPMAACKQMSGEQMNRATRNTPPVQGLSQPYTCPTPTGMACSSCKVNKVQVSGVWADNARTKPRGED